MDELGSQNEITFLQAKNQQKTENSTAMQFSDLENDELWRIFPERTQISKISLIFI